MLATLLLALSTPFLLGSTPTGLDFEARVEAQTALDRVYYAHRIGTTRTFEEAFPRQAIERKVRTYLAQSAALEHVWGRRITAAMLRSELERIARETRLPERLAELYTALGHDPVLVQECLARPVLVDRLTRNLFAHDRSIHPDTLRRAEELRARLDSGDIDPRSDHPLREVVTVERRSGEATEPVEPGGDRSFALDPEEFDEWRQRGARRTGEIGPVIELRDRFVIEIVLEREKDHLVLARFSVPKKSWADWFAEVAEALDPSTVAAVASSDLVLPAPGGRAGAEDFSCPGDSWAPIGTAFPSWREGHTAVWTGSLMIVWGGGPGNPEGGRYDPVTDTWTPLSTTNEPTRRSGHVAVWTGSEMIVWGGSQASGGRYDPVADSWTPVSTVNAPIGTDENSAVWTGSEMIVWGGHGDGVFRTDTGGRYDPVTDTWIAVSTTDAPSARRQHSAVWTGSEMIVWGGWEGSPTSPVNTGGRYDPIDDSWTPVSTVDTPGASSDHTAIWTGDLMIVFRGISGGRYDPATDSWTPMSNTDASYRAGAAVWTGEAMIVWTGVHRDPIPPMPPLPAFPGYPGGSRYDPATDTWEAMSTNGAPTARHEHTAVWTGSEVLIWGGASSAGSRLDSGARYDPDANSWAPIAPHAAGFRQDHTAVWTGSEMIVWGGDAWSGDILFEPDRDGGRYDPVMDHWGSMSVTDAPRDRRAHSAVWNGDRMIVWGGTVAGEAVDTGGVYDPVADLWTPTSTSGAPSARAGHSAVWTGTEMVIWGSGTGGGARYDPASDSWTPVSDVGAPSPRVWRRAVWTGSEMIIWGGRSSSSPPGNTGGRYDPGSDLWTATSTTGAPSARFGHTAVWIGGEMIVWGGEENDVGELTDTGGRYDPSNDTWTPITTTDAPAPRKWHGATWVGDRMIVWGGVVDPLGNVTNSGARYDPVADAWTPMSGAGAPGARAYFPAVAAGDVALIWGGGSQQDQAAFTFGDGAIYCSCASATVFPDSDGDGFGDPEGGLQTCTPPPGYVDNGDDCQDGDAANWAAPSEVGTLLFSDAQTLAWSAPFEPGATSIVYDLIRSDDVTDFVAAAICIDWDIGGTASTDNESPAPGAPWSYLVRGVSGCPDGDGSVGPRSARTCP